MDFAQGVSPRPQLSRPWRRGLIATTAGSALALLLVHLFAAEQSALPYVADLVFAGVALVCLWLLADAFRPWIGGEETPPAERAHADAAVRRAYGVLVWAAIACAVYLQIFEGNAGGGFTGTRERVILPFVLALVVLLPAGISAWDDVFPGHSAASVGPVTLTMARFRGPSAGAHAATLLALLMGAVLLALFGGLRSPRDELILKVASAATLVLLTVVVPLALRPRNIGREGRTHGRAR